MTVTLTQESLDRLLGRFADAEPTPGGGSASALAGALAASLAAMVCRLTVGKKGYEAASDEAASLRDAADTLARRLREAVEADAASFERVMAAMALPRADESQKSERQAAMQAAFQHATLVPLDTARACLEAGRLASRLLAIGNRNASTDAGVAVLLSVAGGEGALFNAAINLGSIKDAAWVDSRRAELAPLWTELDALRGALWPAIRDAGVETPRGLS
ncbi:MAG TPA: cyclodeaminase/cyclohydrolase family protein [Oscillatoriaceae cyanobacterium]